MEQSTVDRVREIIRQQLGVEDDAIQPAASFVHHLGADSRALVELTIAFEEAFDVEISDQDAEKIRTVGDAINQVSLLVERGSRGT
jgi:acyl carrier protein